MPSQLKKEIDLKVHNPASKLLGWWVNVNGYGNTNACHDHYDRTPPAGPVGISGVFYISIPKPGMGNITFYNDAPPYMKELHSKSMSIEPKENTLILFPSWLEHSVSQSKSDEPRISMSFNYLSKTVTPDDKIADLKSGIRRLS